MRRTCGGGALAAVLAVLLVLAAAAGAAVVKNTATDETLKGTLTNQSINGLRIFIETDGTKHYLNMDEWQVLEADKPATNQPAVKPADSAKSATGKPAPAAKPLVYIIPIVGEIKSMFLVKAVEKALAEAKTKKASVVVFRMDTPGGRVDIGYKLVEMIGKVDWAKTVGWVNGDVQKGAISCGAFISLATEAIYVTPGTSIGASVPWHSTRSGSAEVDEKMQSILSATFRSLAEKRGYPKAMSDAMVNTTKDGIVQVFVDGVKQYVTFAEAAQLEREHRGDGKFSRGKTVCQTGKILCLTANEAVEFDLAKALTTDQKDLLDKLGLADATVVEAKISGAPLTDWVAKQADASKAEFSKTLAEIRTNLQQASTYDPQRNLPLTQQGTQPWNNMAAQCKVYLRLAAEAIKKYEKLIDEEYGADAAKEFSDEVATAKAEMEAMYARLGR